MKNIKMLVFAGYVLFAAAWVSADTGISVTEVNVSGKTADIVINDVIEIREIEILRGDIKFPEYISKSGNVFPQVKFLDPEARNMVVDAIMQGKPSRKAIRKINYKVSKMSPYSKEGSSLKAFAAVTFNGILEVECKVMESSRQEGDYWIAWPARPPDRDRGETKWVDQVTIINKKVKSIVEQDLKESVGKMGPGGTDMTDVDVDIKSGLVNAPLTVTDVKVAKVEGMGDMKAIAQVDLNYSIRIMDIKVYEKEGETFLEFPMYVSSKGKEYEQMRVFSRKLRSDIREAIKKKVPSSEPSDMIGYEITKFEKFWKDDSSLKYFCAVTLNGAVEVECKILDNSSYEPFVGWPSNNEGGKYVDKIVPCNKEVKDEMEQALLKRYMDESGAADNKK